MLFSDDIRRRITDDLLPCISRALRVKNHVGTRYAACQCVRALSCAVAALRTNIVDSGLGMDISKIVLGRQLGDKSGVNVGNGTKGKEDASVASEKEEDDAMEGDGGDEMKSLKVLKGLGKDRRVIGAALAAVCNILTNFSPLKPVRLFSPSLRFYLENLRL